MINTNPRKTKSEIITKIGSYIDKNDYMQLFGYQITEFSILKRLKNDKYRSKALKNHKKAELLKFLSDIEDKHFCQSCGNVENNTYISNAEWMFYFTCNKCEFYERERWLPEHIETVLKSIEKKYVDISFECSIGHEDIYIKIMYSNFCEECIIDDFYSSDYVEAFIKNHDWEAILEEVRS